MKVVLINPPPRQIIEKRYDTPEYPHLGLGYIAAYLESKNIFCRVIDAKLERINQETILQRLKNGFDIIGITAMTHEINQSAYVAESIKKEFPGSVIIIGGVHSTALPKETLEQFRCFDIACIGEGEKTFHEICTTIEQKKDLSSVKGIAYRTGEHIVINERRGFIEALDELPLPAWHLFPKAQIYPVITARGCPFKCIFCMRPNGNYQRKRSPEGVLSELLLIVDTYAPREILFCDETFTMDFDRAIKILDLMILNGINKKVIWATQTHVNTVNIELLRKMKEAGCKFVGIGVESGNSEILKNTKKGITLESAERAFALTKKAKLPTEGYFIFGHPNETRDTANDTIDFAVKLNPTTPVFGIMVPYPGTEIAELARKGEGGYRLISTNWEDYNKQLGNSLELKSLTRRDLELLQLKGYLKVFIFNFRIIDLSLFLWRYKKEGFYFARNYVLHVMKKNSKSI